MRLSLHGAARDVTGSCHLLETDDARILIDCGMFQGGRALREDNADPFGFEPRDIDCVLLTHAHLDHCGRLPLLVKRGFTGRIYATSASHDLARVVLLDAAGMQEEEARRASRSARRRGERGRVEPLFDMVDTLDAIERFSRRPLHYGQWLDVHEGRKSKIRVRFEDAGHILGSAWLCIEVTEHGRTRRLVFSGDLGSSGRPIVCDPTPPPEADLVVLESTYGDRDHRGYEASVEEFYDVIDAALARGGNVFIPSFAIERSQELLIALCDGLAAGRLPESMQVYLDSPMAINATGIYRRHPECFDDETLARFARADPFGLPHLHYSRGSHESRAINDIEGGAVVLAGSGMATGGRILHHMQHNLWREECSFVFVSFASHGTLARQIIDGAEEVRVMGRTVAVRAGVHTINGFSAHAGQRELTEWRRAAGTSARTVLVHGEADVMDAFARHLQEAIPGLGEVHCPARHEVLEL